MSIDLIRFIYLVFKYDCTTYSYFFLNPLPDFLAKRAASYGAKVAIIESNRYGGTCVNVGCVPKKIMFNASHVAETMKEAHQFGFKVMHRPSLSAAELPCYYWLSCEYPIYCIPYLCNRKHLHFQHLP